MAVLPAAVLVAVLAEIFLVTPDGTGFLQPIDDAVANLLAGSTSGSLHGTVTTASLLIPAVMAAVAGLCIWRAGHRARTAMTPAVAMAVGWAVAAVPAHLITRPGPGRIGDLASSVATAFPSVAGAMTAAMVLTARRLLSVRRRDGLVVAIGLMSMLAVARLVAGVSWPFDEVVGGVLGAQAAWSLAPPGRAVAGRRRHRSPRRRARILAVSVVALAGLVPVARSYAAYLTAPGDVGVDQRTIEWMRDVGLGPIVDRAESWWLWQHLPSTTATISALPINAVDIGSAGPVPAAIGVPIRPMLSGEGIWRIAARDTAGATQTATTIFRPDPAHRSLIAGAVWMNHVTTRVELIAGTMQPGGGAGPAGAKVPATQLGSLLAAFNSGYKMKDTPGGALVEGRQVRSMVAGVATVGIRADGTATVGQWGRDMTAADGFVSLRQNLHLMVDGGLTVPGLATNTGGRWGTVRNVLPTWRSGLGVTDAGDLVYVAGDNLTLGALGDALVRIGAVRGMELDIHQGMVTFNLFTHAGQPVGHKLLPDMPKSANRYLSADWRDFFTVVSR